MTVHAVSEQHIANIHDELKRLWDQEQGQNKIRASLFNLIVYIHGTEKLSTYQKLIHHVISKFPSRVICIIADNKGKEPYLHTQVSSQTIGEGELQIFCELIQIETSHTFYERVPFLVIPHILPDLPVYLLWTQDPTSDVILPYLEPYATRIIFDADANLQTFSRAILALMNRCECDVSDLSWSALSGWRTLLSRTFDHKEAFYSLGQCHHLTIAYNKPSEKQAAYLQAWLAARLNWKFQAFELVEGNIRISYRRPMHEVVVLLIPRVEPSLPPGAICSLEIKSGLHEGHYTFERISNTRRLCVHFSDTQKCDLPHTSFLPGIQEGQTILEEIFYPLSHDHYQAMLDVLAKIPWHLS